MRGEVEIYRANELVYHDSNMIVDGAGKTIADAMTVSRSLSGIEDTATSSILDASNYTVQAISFGKDLETFSKYAHAYHPNTRNLLYDSTFSSVDDGTGRAISGETDADDYLVSSLPWITPPPGFEDTPSATAHVTLLLDRSNSNIINFNHVLNLRTAPAIHDVTPSGLQDKWLCYSMYFKPDPENYPWNLDSEDDYITAGQRARLEFKLQAVSPDFVGYPDPGMGRNSVLLWFDPETGDVSSILPSTFNNDDREDVAGYAMTDWNGHAGVVSVGDGWYRIWNAIPCPSACDYINMDLYPAGYEAGTYIGESSGGCYTFGHQLELGRWPTPLQFNSGHRTTGWDLSGSVLSEWYGKYGSDGIHPIDKGTVRVVTDPNEAGFVSSLLVDNTPGEWPNPEMTRLEHGSVQPLDFSANFSSMEFGQNPNFIPFRSFSSVGSITREPYMFSAWGNTSSVKYCVDSMQGLFGANTLAYSYYWGLSHMSGIGSLGNQAYYLGCYPEGSSTGGSTYAMVSALDSSTAYENVNHSGTYYGTFNEASSMDNFGFVNMIMSSVPITGYPMSSTASGLCLSAPAAPNYIGPEYIEYSVTIGAGDVGYSNLYGGITKMALWTLDVPESLKAGNTPPYAFSVLNNPRKYRMFCTKNFQKNICYINDRSTRPGADQYDDLLVKWRIHFR